MVIDTHVHVWHPDTAQTPWRAGWGRYAPRPELSVDQLLAAMDGAGVDRAALIPPEWDAHGNELVLAGAAAHPDRLAAFPSLSLRDPASPGRLAQWCEEPGFLGLRQVFLVSPAYAPLTDGSAEWLFREAEDRGLTLMVWLPRQLPALPRIVDRFPRISFVVDHLNLPMDPLAGELESTVDELLRLADRPHVSVKASALPTMAAGPYPYPAVHPAVRRVVAAFGADRVFWGSDFTRLPCGYPQARSMVDHIGLGYGDRAAILGGSFARRVNWPAEVPSRRSTDRTEPRGQRND